MCAHYVCGAKPAVHIYIYIYSEVTIYIYIYSEVNMKLELMNNRREADEQKLKKSK